MKLKRIEHVAIAVRDMDGAGAAIGAVFGLAPAHAETLGSVRLAMYPVGESSLELLEGLAPDSQVTRWIAEHGEGLFHICFEVDDIDAALAELKAKGVKLLDEVPRPGHAGARIAFIDPAATGNVLFELAELPAGGGGH
jgi:methylmalonyl-CoA/ethylmalonyl-CoA epimerase